MHCDGVPFLSLNLSPSLLARRIWRAALCPGLRPGPAEEHRPSDSQHFWGGVFVDRDTGG
jgi:hypothetical protein